MAEEAHHINAAAAATAVAVAARTKGKRVKPGKEHRNFCELSSYDRNRDSKWQNRWRNKCSRQRWWMSLMKMNKSSSVSYQTSLSSWTNLLFLLPKCMHFHYHFIMWLFAACVFLSACSLFRLAKCLRIFSFHRVAFATLSQVVWLLQPLQIIVTYV